MAVKPSPEPLRVPVPAVTWISKKSLFARTYCPSCNVRILHRVGIYHSLSKLFPDFSRHAHSLCVASTPVTIPVVNPFHSLPAFCTIENCSLNRSRSFTFPVLGILIPDFQNSL